MEDPSGDVEMPPEDVFSFDPSRLVSGWTRKFNDGVLTPAVFEKHWQDWVPRIYSPSVNENCLNWQFNEEQAQNILFYPLVEFICDGDPSIVLDRLSRDDKPSSVCGRVFKMSEPTYSCRECGMDNTCVLCVDCFKNSEHRHHKYKMGTSLGGGCCDCGDVEAWKKAPYCDIHVAGTVQNEDKQGGLPEAFKERARIVFDSVLWYAYRLLNVDHIADLKFSDSSIAFRDTDTYCTILYNDEVHTFEQVISTLSRVLKCTQRNAIAFVTNIDREGRAIVKCAPFQHCDELRQEIEKYTSRHGNKPLKVIVSHTYVIAHQLYGMKLLAWLQEFLGHGEGFRSVFLEVVLKPQESSSCIVKEILLRDSSLWKSARSQWHRLLISGMLLEYESKKQLAKMFTKYYGPVMKDFIRDDHDHLYSVASLSVQLFTVPTIAHHLIAYDDILFVLLNTFNSECATKCNKTGKLEFERTPAGLTFKRAQHMLYDFKYLLSSVPDVWNDDLRKSFLHGLSCLLNLLSMMQGMDCVTRQVGQHMEYEPEWEAAFNLHIKLSSCISLVLKWCSTDRVVLIKAYRAALKKLEENPCYDPSEPLEVRELADHSTACLHFDVSSKPVSIHLPLTRFLAGLHLSLEKFNLTFDSPEFQGVTKPTPVQIIEPVLRAQVLISQVHANMWRRNGYGLLNQLFFYHNVKFRAEMLDRDISVLQIGASLIESNEFLMHVLNKFNLINWANSDFEITSLRSPEEDSIIQTINLVEEFLQILIIIIGERYMPGVSNVTNDERLKKEIIQNLCIRPLAHSELNKNIQDDVTYETPLDDVINELADFKRPVNSSGKGVYELKNELYNNYNVFFYHYTKEELSKSEVNQRNRRKDAGELECCPPPELPKLNESFGMIVNLLQCDVMLHVMETILSRCVNLRARSFSELQLHKILHLIGYALHEENSKHYPFFKFIENSAKFKILPLMEELLSCPRVEAHKDLLKWTIKKYKQVANQVEATPSTSFEPIREEAKINSEKERRARLAAERRAKVMAQMSSMAKSFMKEHAKLFEESTADPLTNLEKNVELSGSAMDLTEHFDPDQKPIAVGPNQTSRQICEKQYTCILCQEEAILTPHGPTLVLAAFVQQATVLCQHKNEELMDITKHDPLFLHSNLGPAPHISTCGHVMHSDCWRKFFDSVMLKEHRRPYRLRNPASFDVDKQEFLCPLCECLSNTVLPIVPPLSILQPPPVEKNAISFNDYLECLKTIVTHKSKYCHGNYDCDKNCQNFHCEACYSASKESLENDTRSHCEANCTSQPHQVFYSLNLNDVKPRLGKESESFVSLIPKHVSDLNQNLTQMVTLFAQVAYTRGLNVQPHPSDKRIAPITWKALSYTLHSIEILLRDANKPLLGHLSSRQRDCLESLVRIVGVLGSTWPKSVVTKSHALNLLTILLEHLDDGPSILQWDSIGFLIPLTFSLPSLASSDSPSGIPTGGMLEYHTLRLIYISHIVKTLILMDPNQFGQSMEHDSNDSTIVDVLKLMNRSVDNINTHSVWKHVQDACIPFLRCCVLFYRYLTDVPAPPVLTEVGGDTFSNMCTYLDLPQSPKEIFDSPLVMNCVRKWRYHEEVISFVNGTPLQVVYEPLQVNRLIDLPNDYSDLINSVSSFTCPKSDHDDSRNPTMCLVCGEILCSQSYCCQTEVNKVLVGACNYHAHKCGAGVGIFLRVRECEILFLVTHYRGCFISPPYLDDYGETDQGLRRGNPLKLCPERYKKLQTIWLSHSIHEEIARAIETSTHVVTTQWHHL